MIARDGDRFRLVEQFRYPLGLRRWEFPQGTAPGRADLDPAELAARELREETGLRAESMVAIGLLDVAPGMSSQRGRVFLATGITEGEHDREHEEQDMHSEWFTRAEVEQMMRDGDITDAQSMAAWALLLLSERSRRTPRPGQTRYPTPRVRPAPGRGRRICQSDGVGAEQAIRSGAPVSRGACKENLGGVGRVAGLGAVASGIPVRTGIDLHVIGRDRLGPASAPAPLNEVRNAPGSTMSSRMPNRSTSLAGRRAAATTMSPAPSAGFGDRATESRARAPVMSHTPLLIDCHDRIVYPHLTRGDHHSFPMVDTAS